MFLFASFDGIVLLDFLGFRHEYGSYDGEHGLKCVLVSHAWMSMLRVCYLTKLVKFTLWADEYALLLVSRAWMGMLCICYLTKLVKNTLWADEYALLLTSFDGIVFRVFWASA